MFYMILIMLLKAICIIGLLALILWLCGIVLMFCHCIKEAIREFFNL